MKKILLLFLSTNLIYSFNNKDNLNKSFISINSGKKNRLLYLLGIESHNNFSFGRLKKCQRNKLKYRKNNNL